MKDYSTIEELEKDLGPLTEEEQRILAERGSEPTEEEIKKFKEEHPNFEEETIKRVLARIRKK